MLQLYRTTQLIIGLAILTLILSPNLAFSQAQVTENCILENFRTTNDHAVYLASLPGSPSPRYVFDSLGGNLTIYNDSTAQVTGIAHHESRPNYQWEVNMWLINKRNYADWTALGRGIKAEQAPRSVVDANKQDWHFYELDETRSTLIGVPGTFYDGDTLILSHRPSNLEFGFQQGIGANGKNGNEGISGWFYYSGAYSGVGDLNANQSCETPVCDVAIDSVVATCDAGDSTFSVDLIVSGTGTFDVSDDKGSPVQQGGANTYTFGPYADSDTVIFSAVDILVANCSASSSPVWAECSQNTCSVSIDTLYTECISDSSFRAVLVFSGVGSDFTISDDQGTPLATGLSPGTHNFGNYLNSTDVWITVSDTNFQTCIDSLGPVSADCTPQCNAGIDTLYTRCKTDSTFEIISIITGVPVTPGGFTIYTFDLANSQNNPLDTIRNVMPDTIAVGDYAFGTYIGFRLWDDDLTRQECGVFIDSVTYLPDSSFQTCDTTGRGSFAAGISNFSATLIDKQVTLTWQDLSSASGSIYEIEKSIGAAPFKIIGSLKADEMNFSMNAYVFKDNNIEVNTPYSYRIRERMKDGVKAYSQPVQLFEKIGSGVMFGNIYPNPSSHFAKVKLNAIEAHTLSCDIFNVQGQKVSASVIRTFAGAQEIDLPTEDLQAGIYFVRFELENSEGYLRKFVIQK